MFFIVTNNEHGKPSRDFSTLEAAQKALDKKCITGAAAYHKITSLMIREREAAEPEFSNIVLDLDEGAIQARRIEVLERLNGEVTGAIFTK